MHAYKVTIDFKGGPSFTVEARAANAEDAKKAALADARYMGWTAPVKKYVAVEVAEAAA